MTRMSRTERSALCDTALAVGEDRPTLCAGWDVKDLVVHLVLRESSPAALGIVVPPLARLTDLAAGRLAKHDFRSLVERLRGGPPLYSPLALPKADDLANTLEFFVHHEDIRRAQPSWQPRSLDDRQQEVLWRHLPGAAKHLLRGAAVGVVAEHSDTGERATLRRGAAEVVVRGLPSEVVLFVFGRRAQADVALLGEPDAVASLQQADSGI